MTGRILLARFFAVAIAAFAVLAGPVRAQTGPVTATALGQAQVLRPLTVQKVEDLEFGIIAATAAGTVVIDPNTNALTTTGGVVSLGGNPNAAQFTGAAQRSAVVIIRVPKQPVRLVRAGGTEMITLSNFTLQGQDKRAIAAQSSFDFRVGGTLTVAAGQAEGTYAGTFTVEVHYP